MGPIEKLHFNFPDPVNNQVKIHSRIVSDNFYQVADELGIKEVAENTLKENDKQNLVMVTLEGRSLYYQPNDYKKIQDIAAKSFPATTEALQKEIPPFYFEKQLALLKEKINDFKDEKKQALIKLNFPKEFAAIISYMANSKSLNDPSVKAVFKEFVTQGVSLLVTMSPEIILKASPSKELVQKQESDRLSANGFYEKVNGLVGAIQQSQKERLSAEPERRQRLYEKIKADIENLSVNLPPLNAAEMGSYRDAENLTRVLAQLERLFAYLRTEIEKGHPLDAGVEVSIAWACAACRKMADNLIDYFNQASVYANQPAAPPPYQPPTPKAIESSQWVSTLKEMYGKLKTTRLNPKEIADYRTTLKGMESSPSSSSAQSDEVAKLKEAVKVVIQEQESNHLSADEFYQKVNLLFNSIQQSQKERISASLEQKQKIYEKIKADIESLTDNLPPHGTTEMEGYLKTDNIMRILVELKEMNNYLFHEEQNATPAEAGIKEMMKSAHQACKKLAKNIFDLKSNNS